MEDQLSTDLSRWTSEPAAAGNLSLLDAGDGIVSLQQFHAGIDLGPSPHGDCSLELANSGPIRSLAKASLTLPGDQTFSNFVECYFVPDYVSNRQSSGREFYKSMLKHVMTPEQVDKAFHLGSEKSRAKLRVESGWPYIGALRLSDIRVGHVQELISAALGQGYSIQTALHIRNAIRAVFSHAQCAVGYIGINPARHVVVPTVAPRETSTLSLEQLRRAIRLTRYPAREAILLATLTDMNMCEICGLKWKHVNLTAVPKMLDSEEIPARCIAIRNQIYRYEASPVAGYRARLVRVSDPLHAFLSNIRDYRKVSDDAYVLSARNGSPISQCNIAARDLRRIETEIGVERLTWLVFQRTNRALTSQLGNRFEYELRKALPVERIW